MIIKAATVQFHHAPGEKAANLDRMYSFCREAAEKGIQLLIFPEMCITGYWHIRKLSRPEIEKLGEPIESGPSVEKIRKWAADLSLIIGAGLIEQASDGSLYNCYVVALPDGSLQYHRKLHCFISEHMKSGNRYTVFPTHLGVTLGVLTCYDNNLVENCRITALLGADILLAPHQTGGCITKSPHAMGGIDLKLWERRREDPEAIEAEFKGPKGREWLMRWLPARAHDNGMFLLFSNGVGVDDDEVRTGNAMIIDCYGRIIAETWKAEDVMVTGELDTDLLEMSTGRRWIRGRRPELYGKITEKTGKELDPRTARFS